MKRFLIADCILQNEFTSSKGKCVLAVLGFSALMTIRVVGSMSLTQQKGCMPYLYPFIPSSELMRYLVCGSVILLFCNAPFCDKSFPYILIRAGKRQWVKGVWTYLILASLLLSFVLLGVSVAGLLPHVTFGKAWGDVINKISLSGYVSGYGTAILIDEMVIANYKPMEAVFISFLLQTLLFLILGSIAVCSSLVINQAAGIIIPVFLVVFSSFTNWALNRTLFCLSPVSWMNINEILGMNSDYYPSLKYILLFYILGIIIMYAGAYFYVSRKDFSTVTL